MNHVKPFRNRTIDLTAPVKVYRNLNKPGVVYSLQQNGLIVAHATYVCLMDVKFKVNEAGRQRVIAEKRKNVHAFVIGKFAAGGLESEGRPASYNPYKAAHFVLKDNQTPLFISRVATLGANGLTVQLYQL